jgi:hypothetical protein
MKYLRFIIEIEGGERKRLRKRVVRRLLFDDAGFG